MLIPFDHPAARGRAPVDPSTGKIFKHVHGVDVEAGMLDFYTTTLAHPDAKMVLSGREVDGYTFVSVRDPATGRSEFMTRLVRLAFELVDLKTGEVLREVEGPPCPPLYLDPATYWREQDQRAGGVWTQSVSAHAGEQLGHPPAGRRAEMEALLSDEKGTT